MKVFNQFSIMFLSAILMLILNNASAQDFMSTPEGNYLFEKNEYFKFKSTPKLGHDTAFHHLSFIAPGISKNDPDSIVKLNKEIWSVIKQACPHCATVETVPSVDSLPTYRYSFSSVGYNEISNDYCELISEEENQLRELKSQIARIYMKKNIPLVELVDESYKDCERKELIHYLSLAAKIIGE